MADSQYQWDFAKRIRKLQQQLSAHQTVIISNPFDLLYFVGFITLTPFEREAFLLINQDNATLVLSSFSQNKPIENVTQTFMSASRPFGKLVLDFIGSQTLHLPISVDSKSMTVSELESLKQFLHAEQISTTPLIISKQLRIIKDTQEIRATETANKRTHQALSKTLKKLQTGMSEIEVQDLFESELKNHQSEPLAFPTIVAFGEHTALPHHQPTDRKLKLDEPVLIDCGATEQFYCADVTRTVWFGQNPSSEFLKIERIIQQAYLNTLKVLSTHNTANGLKAKDLDAACRTYIEKNGYGKYFIHTTGHGVGLYIHESPSLSSRDETLIRENMVITIEPGIYLEGNFGYRFENSIHITENGYQELGIINQ